MSTQDERDLEIAKLFADLYYARSAPWMQVFWQGRQVVKCPNDLWTYQEIIFETRPTVLLETGTQGGGSAAYFASLFDLMGVGRVYTVDIAQALYASAASIHHARITHMLGDAVSDLVMDDMRRAAHGQRTMVVLDSAHTYDQVSVELALYSPLVSPGCYLVVEDTNVDSYWGKPSAHAATMDFLATHPNFTIDKTREKHLLTMSPDGWLKRMS